jgi:anti-sigma B factor antagonist
LQQHFRVEIGAANGATVLTLYGELDMSSAPALEDELHRIEAASLVVIDLRSLEFIDSTGLGVLVKMHRRQQDADRRLTLVDGGGQVGRLLELTGLADELSVAKDLDTALESA